MLLTKDGRSEWISARSENVTKAAAFEQFDSQARVSFVFSNYKSVRDVPFTNFLGGSRISLSGNLPWQFPFDSILAVSIRSVILKRLFLLQSFFPRTLLYVLLNKLARCLSSEKGFSGKYGAMTRQQRANIGKL